MSRCTVGARISRARIRRIRWERSAQRAAMLEYTFGLMKEAAAVNDADRQGARIGAVTADLKPKGNAGDDGGKSAQASECRQYEAVNRLSRTRLSRKSGTATWSREKPGASALLYIDLHLVHEVTSPQAFDGLRRRGLKVRRPDLTIATTDHSTPTTPRGLPILDHGRRGAGRSAGKELQRFRHSSATALKANSRALST